MNKQELAAYIDHTALKATVTPNDVERLCAEAKANGFAAVCVNPVYVPLTASLLAGSSVRTCTVIGFPLGAAANSVKAFEARQALADGARELDMVINVGAAINGDWQTVQEDIRAVVRAARETEAATGEAVTVKVIIETCYLEDREKRRACLAAREAGADFVKTSTGFGTGGATEHDVALMRETVGPNMGVKASGGIGDKQTALAMLRAGANRLGASAGVKILS